MKRVLLVLLAVVFVLSPVFAAEKSGFTELKSKIGVGCSVTGSGASVRFWPADSLGFEGTVGLNISTDYLRLPIEAALLFPLMEKGNFALYAAPGIGFTYTKNSAVTSGFSFSIGADILVEMALPMISQNLSIGSGIGLWYSFSSSTSTLTPGANTDFNLNIVTVTPLVVRYYF